MAFKSKSIVIDKRSVEIQVYGKVNTFMQMRYVYEEDELAKDDDEYVSSWFQCGIDVMIIQGGRPIITSVVDVFGWDFEDFFRNHYRLIHQPNKYVKDKVITKVIFCDDSMEGMDMPIKSKNVLGKLFEGFE